MHGLRKASHAVAEHDKWERCLLHIWATSPFIKDELVRVYNTLPAGLKTGSLVLITIAAASEFEQDDVIFSNAPKWFQGGRDGDGSGRARGEKRSGNSRLEDRRRAAAAAAASQRKVFGRSFGSDWKSTPVGQKFISAQTIRQARIDKVFGRAGFKEAAGSRP